MSYKVSNETILAYVSRIHTLQTTGDCDGLWIGNLNGKAKEALVDLGLITMTRIANFDQFGNVESTDRYWILTNWGLAIASKLGNG